MMRKKDFKLNRQFIKIVNNQILHNYKVILLDLFLEEKCYLLQVHLNCFYPLNLEEKVWRLNRENLNKDENQIKNYQFLVRKAFKKL